MNFWEIVYFGSILYCLPFLLLAFTLTCFRDAASATSLPKWWQIICGIGALEVMLLRVGLVIPVIAAPALLLELFGAPISARVISVAIFILSYGCVIFSMMPPKRERCARWI